VEYEEEEEEKEEVEEEIPTRATSKRSLVSQPLSLVKFDLLVSKPLLSNATRAATAWFGPNGDDGSKAALIKQNPLINLPYIVDAAADGLVVTQSNACYTYLARKLSLYGATEKDAAEVGLYTLNPVTLGESGCPKPSRLASNWSLSQGREA
jgi:hypothetical protein